MNARQRVLLIGEDEICWPLAEGLIDGGYQVRVAGMNSSPDDLDWQPHYVVIDSDALDAGIDALFDELAGRGATMVLLPMSGQLEQRQRQLSAMLN